MSQAMAPVPQDHPLMQAWNAYKATEDYANSAYWAMTETTMRPERAAELDADSTASRVTDEQRKRYVEGSLWASFLAGFKAAGGDVRI